MYHCIDPLYHLTINRVNAIAKSLYFLFAVTNFLLLRVLCSEYYWQAIYIGQTYVNMCIHMVKVINFSTIRSLLSIFSPAHTSTLHVHVSKIWSIRTSYIGNSILNFELTNISSFFFCILCCYLHVPTLVKSCTVCTCTSICIILTFSK